MVIRKGTKEQTMINQTLHRTLKISQHKFHFIVPAPLIAPVVLLLNDTDIMWYGNRVEHGCTKIYTNKIRHHLIYECPRIKDSHNPTRGFSDYDRFDLSQINKFYSMLSFVHTSVHYIVSSFYYFVYDL